MEEKEFKFEIKELWSHELLVDETYQRELKMDRVRKIVSHFDPNLVNYVKVSYRGGKYWIFDGQHTARALMLRNNDNDTLIPCKVFYGMTYEDEAWLFSQQDGLSSPVILRQKLLSRYLAKDPEIIDFRETIENIGIKCDFKSHGNVKNTISCYGVVYNIYKRYGKTYLKDLLSLIMRIWPDDKDALRKEIISGLNVFIQSYFDDINMIKFIAKMKKKTPIEIIRKGNTMLYGGDRRYARQILIIYNTGLKQKLDDIL